MKRRISSPVAFGLLLLSALSWGCQPRRAAPEVSAGRLDLADWSFARDGVVRLDGEWAYAPLAHLDGAQMRQAGRFVRVPGVWGEEARPAGQRRGHGFATYAVLVDLPRPAPRELALRLSIVSTAYELWVDGELLASAGEVSQDGGGAPAYSPRIVLIPEQTDGQVQIVFHVSNFAYPKGGLWEPLWLGPPERLRGEREGRVGLAMFLVGAFTLLGAYHLILWWPRRSDPSPLLFAVLCFGMAVRGLTVDEVFLVDLFGGLSWDLVVRLEYASMMVTLGFVSLFMGALFPRELPPALTRAFFALCLAFLVAIALLPVDIFSRGLPAMQLLLLFASVVAPSLVVLAIRRGREGGWFFLVGLLAIGLATTHDILISVFRDLPTFDIFGGRFYLQPFGLLLFAACQSAVLALRASHTVLELEQVGRELGEARDELEQRVGERTAALERANEELERLAGHDELTGLANRRRFEEQLRLAWGDHARRKAELSVLMADVDHFKRFNDRYGHLAGDEALRMVADRVAQAVRRPRDLVARYGGEEFVVLLGDTDRDGARHLAETLRAAVEEAAVPHHDNRPRVVTLSVGVATCVPEPGQEALQLVESADAALYEAKGSGRNRVWALGDPAAPTLASDE